MATVDSRFAVGLVASMTLDEKSLGRVQKVIDEKLGKSTSRVGEKSLDRFSFGLRGIRSEWGEISKHARDVRESVDHITRSFSPLAAIEGLGGLAGLGGMIERFGSGGAEIGRTAATLGIGTAALQRYRGAAQLAGLSADDATGALDKLSRTSYAAQYGLPGGLGAIGAARQLDPTGNLYSALISGKPKLFLDRLADKIKGASPPVQRMIAEAFGLEGLLPLLRQGSEGLEDFAHRAEQLNFLTKDQVLQADRLRLSFAESTMATEGFANALASELSPALKPVLDGYTGFMEGLKNSPERMKVAAAATGILASAFGVTLVSGILKATWAMNAYWATPFMRFLVASRLGIAGLAMGLTTSNGFSQFVPMSKEDRINQLWREMALRKHPPGSPIKQLWNWLTGGGSTASSAPPPSSTARGPGTAGDPRGMIPVLRAAAAANGLNPDDVVAVARAEGLHVKGYGNPDSGSTSYGALQAFMGGGLGNDYQNVTGKNPADPANEADLIQWLVHYGAQHGFRGKWSSVKNRLAPEPRHTASLAVSDPWRLVRGAPGVKFNSRGEPYSSDLDTMSADENARVAASMAAIKAHGFGDYAPATSDDTHHHVLIELAGAAGARASVVAASGPASLQLRTHTAFQDPS